MNNPINAIDPDGRDYILLINHENRTITIKATYYTQNENVVSYNSALQATQFWNNKSGIYSYYVGKANKKIQYTVDFDLIVKQVDNPMVEANKDRAEFIDISEKLTPDQSSNVYQVLPDEDSRFAHNQEGVNTNGVTIGGNVISLKNSRANSDTGSHEVGHTLGLMHFSSGVLTPASNDPKRTNKINEKYIKGIIDNVFIPEKEKAKGRISELGNTPNNFKKGKVKENG